MVIFNSCLSLKLDKQSLEVILKKEISEQKERDMEEAKKLKEASNNVEEV